MTDTLERPTVHHHDIPQFFRFLKHTDVRHLGLLKLKFSTTVHFRDMFCIIVPNFIEIARSLLRP